MGFAVPAAPAKLRPAEFRPAKLSPAEAYALIEADGESFSRAMTEALRAVPNSQAPGKTSGGESERANASEEAAA